MPFLVHYGGLNQKSFVERLKELGLHIEPLGGNVYIVKIDDPENDTEVDDKTAIINSLTSLPSSFIKKLQLAYVPDIKMLENEDILIQTLIRMKDFDKLIEEMLLHQKDDILDSLYTVFQPIFDLKSLSLYAFEALCRGQLPMPYLIKYAKPLLETIDWVCREDAIRKKRRENIPPDIKLFLNFFPESLQDVERASQKLFNLLDKYRVKPTEIVVEITEYEGFDIDKLKILVKRWRNMGILIALDDIGRGEDSLFKFLEIVPDIIKIDMAFIRDIHLNKVKRDITRYLINLAHANNMKVVAEGVEKREELKVVYELGADMVQGWLVGKETPHPSEYLQRPVSFELRNLLEN